MDLVQYAGNLGWLPWVVALLLLLLVVVVIVSYRGVRRRSAADRAPPRQAGAAASLDSPAATAGERRDLRSQLAQLRLTLARATGSDDGIDSVPLVAWVHGGFAPAQQADDPLDALDAAPAMVQLPPLPPGTSCQFRLRRGGVFVELDRDLLTRSDWQRRWELVLRAVSGFRPQRPLDGLIIAIPASDLLAATAMTGGSLSDRGEQLHELVWSLQKLTGLRVPVSLLITGAEVLPGFGPFVERLPPPARDEPLGWPVPYAADTAFRADWVDQGFAAVSSGLQALQAHLLMAGGSESAEAIDQADRIFLLSTDVEKLAQPVRQLLHSMLRTSAYHEAFLFRGFYITGCAPETGDAQAASGASGPRQAFVRRVLAERILRETHLVRPARGALTRRQRQIRWAQTALGVGAVLAVVGLVQTAANRDRVASARELVNELWSEMERVNAAAEANLPSQNAELRTAARNLLRTMSRVSVGSIEVAAAPTSLLTSADDIVEQAIADGYDTIVLKVLWNGLEEQLRQIVPEAGSSSAAAGPVIDEIARVRQFRDTVDELTTFDGFVAVYQSLRETQNIRDLASLVEYAFGVTLPPEFRSNFHLYQHALKRITNTNIPRDRLQQSAEQSLGDYVNSLFDAFYLNGRLLGLSRRFQTQMAGLRSVSAGRSELEALRTTVVEMEAAWSSGRYRWVGLDDGRLDPGIEDSFVKLERLSFVRPEFAAELWQRGRTRMQEGRAALLGRPVLAGQPVIVRDGNEWRLLGELTRVRGVLDDLFAQPFAAADAGAGQRSGTVRFLWNAQALSEANTLSQSLLMKSVDTLSTLPADIREPIRAVQQDMMTAYIDSHLQGPFRFGDGRQGGDASAGSSGLTTELLNFAVAAPMLTNLRDSLTVLGFSRAAGRLRSVADTQALRLLQETDALLASESPYQPLDSTFAGWNGSGPIAAQAYGLSSIADLGVFLSMRREFIERLARDYAQPLVSYLEGERGPRSDALTARWSLILRALDRYRLREPGNTIEQLEQFILTGLDQLTLENCQTEVRSGQFGSDYFGEQLRILKQAMASRCAATSVQWAITSYARIASVFNASLAGRFPFVGILGASSSEVDVIDSPRADPNDIRRFFIAYDGDIAGLEAALRQTDGGGAAASFLDQMSDVRTALAPLARDPSSQWPLSYQVEVEFRTNAARERAGNQILEWSLTIGKAELSSLRPEARSAVWTMGDPVSLTLRWAQLAPNLPLAGDPNWPHVGGNEVTFAYSDPWALFTLIAHNAPAPSDRLALPDRRPEVVQLQVPLRLNPDAALGGDDSLDWATVYLRLGLAAIIRGGREPEQRVAITLPPFPAAAPLPTAGRPPPQRLMGARE